MPATWTQEFDFYMGTREGIPFLESLDLRAMDNVPLASHPRYLRVRVRMLDPRPDGLRSPEETDALYEVEEQLQVGLPGKYDAIYWGKTVGDGFTSFSFQLPAEPEFTAVPVPDPAAIAAYPFEVAVLDDPDWQIYRDLYPNAYQGHQMVNRALQEELRERGDRLKRRRRVNHVALFSSPEKLEQAVKALKRARFRIDSRSFTEAPDTSERYSLEFHRTDACDGRRPNDVTAEILDCIEPSGGLYDGWATFVKA